jgi:hypothetical protein
LSIKEFLDEKNSISSNKFESNPFFFSKNLKLFLILEIQAALVLGYSIIP